MSPEEDNACDHFVGRPRYYCGWRRYLSDQPHALMLSAGSSVRWAPFVTAEAAVKKVDCLFCDDTGWVYESHPNQPWQGNHACTCGGAGTRLADR
jgi:hypothetical protein